MKQKNAGALTAERQEETGDKVQGIPSRYNQFHDNNSICTERQAQFALAGIYYFMERKMEKKTNIIAPDTPDSGRNDSVTKVTGNGRALKKSAAVKAGPVENMEECVQPDWWRKIFNSLYLKTDSDVVNDPRITRREIDMLLEIPGVSQESRVLDLCCGQGRHVLEMARRGFKNVEGLDRSSYLIQKAKSSAKKEYLNVKFREGDARKLPYAGDTFDVVMMLGNSFGYFESAEDDLLVLKEVFRVLKPWGRIIIDIADGEFLRKSFQPRSWEWIDKKMFVCRERSLSADSMRLISREVITHIEKGVVQDQYYAERLYSHESILNIMSRAGFTEISFAGEVVTESERNQDLGMMEKRIITTGQVRKEWTTVKRRTRKAIKEVVVIMGDPCLTDSLKPNCVFDDDDIYTIDQMKDALRLLEGFNFTYMNNHATLIHDLVFCKNKIDFVFNLCDEGFHNDPRKEAHVPAILEMLDIPYTGGGPQCLSFCYDKSLVRGIAKEMEIEVPEAFLIKPEDTTFDIPFGFPVIVKPNFGDSSFGITKESVCHTGEELVDAVSRIRRKFGYNNMILIEEFLTGKDITVGLIGNRDDTYNIFPITEEDYSALPANLPRLCGYEAKWMPDSPYWGIKTVAADLNEEVQKRLEEDCLKLFERLECRDYARFDWRLDAQGVPKLLEANPNPGWCWDGHLAKMAKFAGMNYSEMLEAILGAAERRFGCGSGQ